MPEPFARQAQHERPMASGAAPGSKTGVAIDRWPYRGGRWRDLWATVWQHKSVGVSSGAFLIG